MQTVYVCFIVTGACGKGGKFTLWQMTKKQKMREAEAGIIFFKGTPSMTSHLLQAVFIWLCNPSFGASHGLAAHMSGFFPEENKELNI